MVSWTESYKFQAINDIMNRATPSQTYGNRRPNIGYLITFANGTVNLPTGAAIIPYWMGASIADAESSSSGAKRPPGTPLHYVVKFRIILFAPHLQILA